MNVRRGENYLVSKARKGGYISLALLILTLLPIRVL